MMTITYDAAIRAQRRPRTSVSPFDFRGHIQASYSRCFRRARDRALGIAVELLPLSVGATSKCFSGLNGPGGVFGFYAPGTPP